MIVDPIEQEECRKKVLLAFLDRLETWMEKTPNPDFKSFGMMDSDLVETLGLSKVDIQQFTDELEAEGSLRMVVASRKGRNYSFTSAGLAKAKQLRFEDSPEAKRRERGEKIKEVGKIAGTYLGKKALAAIGTLFVTVVGLAAFKDQIVAWLRHALGLQ